jgi:BirA family biotin operon repressor/biotin-[acetyl-CoA-carboxylase] ligase
MSLGQKIIHLESVDSTNNYAAKLLSEGRIGHGTVILADEQTNGRGQRGTKWSSPASENLLFSLVLQPDNLSVSEQCVLTEITSIALVEFLRKFGISAKVKWPNDILVNGEKIAGVLIENQLKGNSIASSVIGIGLNVNQRTIDLPRVTSIVNHIDAPFLNLTETLLSFLASFDSCSKSYLLLGKSYIREAYLKELYQLKEQAYYSDQNGEFVGEIIGVSEEGLLQIVNEDEIKTYDIKEISFIYRNAF